MNIQQLKKLVSESQYDSLYFTRSNMRFSGDTIANYSVVDGGTVVSEHTEDGKYVPYGVECEVWELKRKKPVKHGLQHSVFFSKSTGSRVYTVAELNPD